MGTPQIIPGDLQQVLARDSRLAGVVNLAVDSIGGWMSRSGTPFFPEYPEHSAAHVARVLSTAWLLMSDESRDCLSPTDAAVLCCAVLVHDTALHLDEPSFMELVSPSNVHIDERFNDQRWPRLWELYLEEVMRADEATLSAMYGAGLFPRRPPDDARLLTTQDRLVIGEFLRRHHHRLAHELTAASGVPALKPVFGPLTGLGDEIRDMAGLVARSHGMPLRECITTLGGRESVRDVLGVHLGYLMAVIRLADYLDLSPDRAPPVLAGIRRFASPVSEGEWGFTGSIKHIGHTKDDPECLDIQAVPPSPREYLRVKSWLDDVDEELRMSAAVIAEIYGRLQELPFALRFMRATSNLLDRSDALRRLPYYPVEARLTTAGPELLKLLVGPLYSGNPAFAVRELIQNAVDAVNAYRRYCEATGAAPDDGNNEPDVTVELRRDTAKACFLVVRDRGIGMTITEVKEYFLKAGSTYRQSQEWREALTSGLGGTTTLRAGRFGIGVLASFLLGGEVEVHTRHASLPESSGMRFKMTLDENAVGIWKHPCARGTTISIRTTPEIFSELERNPESWDWYRLSTPVVWRIRSDGCRIEADSEREVLPAFDSPCPAEWRRLSTDDFPQVDWTFAKGRIAKACNGIPIGSIDDRIKVRWRTPFESLASEPISLGYGQGTMDRRLGFRVHRFPRVSIFDVYGKLPLSLDRTRIGSLPFSADVLDAIAHDLLAHYLAAAPAGHMLNSAHASSYWSRYSSYDSEFMPIEAIVQNTLRSAAPLWWFSTADGTGPLTTWATSRLNAQSVLLLGRSMRQPGPQCGAAHDLTIGFHLWNLAALREFARFCLYEDSQSAVTSLAVLNVVGRRLLVGRHLLGELLSPRKLRAVIRETVVIPWQDDNWAILELGRHNQGCDALRVVARSTDLVDRPTSVFGPGVFVAGEWSLGNPTVLDGPAPSASVLEDHWADIIGQSCLPYDESDRVRELQNAFSALEPYLALHLGE